MSRTNTFKNDNTGIWAGLAAGLLILVVMGVRRPPNRLVPVELVGEWHTSDPNYADRVVGFIKTVKQVPEGTRTLYTIFYTVEDEPNEVSFYYDPNNGKTLWFKNQIKVVWRKDPDS